MSLDEKELPISVNNDEPYKVATPRSKFKSVYFKFYFAITSLFMIIHLYRFNFAPKDEILSPEQVVLKSLESNLAGQWLDKYTSEPSLSGNGKGLADWTRSKFEEYGAKTYLDTYDVYLSFPFEHDLKLIDTKSDKVLYQAPLEEDELDVDAPSHKNRTIPTFLGYAANGRVNAQYVYVNYGSKEDFEELAKLGVDVSGKIAIARYGGVFRGLKIKFAQDHGAVGVLIYTDPGDDHGITPANGYKQYPKGPARHESSVQRGSASFLGAEGSAPGDPTTPGTPSQGDHVERKDPHGSIGKIPALPISYREVKPILEKLNGHGAKTSKKWHGELEGFDYSTGPSPKVTLDLYNNQTYNITPIWNVYGEYEGEKKDEVIIIGNHRDAWVAGAGDPHSGSAVLLEVARVLGDLQKKGYKFKRTIKLASWDGEEQGLLGSTEFGENYAGILQRKVVAYLNLDAAVTGQHLNLGASPVLNKLLKDVAKKLLYPKKEVGTLYDHYINETGGVIENLGSGSDYTVFLEHLGIPSVDLGFGQGKGDPIYQYHSSYDSYNWIAEFADPGFVYHNLAAKYLSLIALELSKEEVIKFGLSDYSSDLLRYFNDSVSTIPHKWFREEVTSEALWQELLTADDANDEYVKEVAQGYYTPTIRDRFPFPEWLTPHQCPHNKIFTMYDTAHHQNKTLGDIVDHVFHELSELHNTTKIFDSRSHDLQVQYNNRDSLHFWQKIKLHFEIKHQNALIQYFERNFLYHKGLYGRGWFKHIVFASGRFTGYAGQTWPGVREAIEDGKFERLVSWLGIVSKTLRRVSSTLV